MTYGEKALQETTIELNTTLTKMAKYEHVLRVVEVLKAVTDKTANGYRTYTMFSNDVVGIGSTLWLSMLDFVNKVHGEGKW